MLFRPQSLARGVLSAALFLAATASVASASGGAASSSAPTHTNRLAGSASPYLLQHAHNPVDWYPWGEEAFARAREEGKPIFLSIGYSTCHWCHVMERESFQDEAIAAYLNEHFICVKVDREERPDVDRIYMMFLQANTGSGGWPLNVWLTPELQPFFGGTYFPPANRQGRPGFQTVLERIAKAWQSDPATVRDSGAKITAWLQEHVTVTGGGVVPEAAAAQAFAAFKETFDPVNGGFGGAPKFPQAAFVQFLFRHHQRTGDAAALDMALRTLRAMAAGGIHDHVGGGFHRYSVDPQWFVPHFEKMLYDQAQLAVAYLEAYQVTGDAEFADVARGVLEYVLRDLTGEQGQLLSAEDADSSLPEDPSKHAEGAFYVWTAGEIERVLGRERAALFNAHYGVRPGGNVADDPHGYFAGKNILATRGGADGAFADALAALAAERTGRPRPSLDDKAITAWNGLMLSALARGFQVLREPRYLAAAERAAAFVRARLFDAQTGLLHRRYRNDEAAIDGFAEDYAFLIQGLLDLYEAGFEVAHLEWAVALQRTQDARFWDEAGHGYFNTTADAEHVLLRMKTDHDGVEPSASSVAALNLLRLARMTDAPEFEERARTTVGAFAGRLAEAPATLPATLGAVEFMRTKPREIVIAGARDAADTQAMLGAFQSRYLPDKVVLLAAGGEAQERLARLAAFVESFEPIDGRATAFVCENQACQLPTTDLAEMRKLLGLSDERAP